MAGRVRKCALSRSKTSLEVTECRCDYSDIVRNAPKSTHASDASTPNAGSNVAADPTNTRSGMTSFHQLAPSRSLSSLVNSETSGSAVPFTAVIGTAPLRLLVQKAPRDSRRSWTEQRRITTGVR
jgi:hypothetical protein